MKPEDLGIVFYKGLIPLWFTSYTIEKDIGKRSEEYLVVTLAGGETIEIRSYYSQSKEQVIPARTAIYKEPGEPMKALRTRR